ncbi:MAG: ABC transporter ATP-binding protein, partial [Promethearchaeia archaeon]
MVAVVGSAGHGKSSLLMALAGYMPRKRGDLAVHGEVALCSRTVILSGLKPITQKD